TLGGAHEAERHARRREGVRIVWADDLDRVERTTLGLVDLPLREQDLGQDTLALAQVTAVAERRQHPYGLARKALGAVGVALLQLELGEMVEAAGLLKSRSRFREQCDRLLVARDRFIEISAESRDVRENVQCLCTRDDRAAILGELACL